MTVIAKDRFLVKLDEDGNIEGYYCNQLEVDRNIIDLISGDTRMKLKVFRANCEDDYLLERKSF
jgi:hypothetical protein